MNMECPFCGGEAKKAMIIHEVKGLAFESEGYACNKCGEEFDTFEQAKGTERVFKKLFEHREKALQRSYQRIGMPIPA